MVLKPYTVSGFGLGRALETAKITKKWRPSLALVIGGGAAGVMATPVIGWLILKWVGPIYGFTFVFGLIVTSSILGGIILAYLFWRLLMRPIQDLAQISSAMAHNPIQAMKPLRHYGTAELRDLGQTVLDTGHTLQNRTRQIQAFSAHTTHELKSPLAALYGAAELLQNDNLSDESRAKLVDGILDSSKRMSDLLDKLRQMSVAASVDRPRPTPISQLDAVDRKGVRIFGMPFLKLDANSAEIIFHQLIENAFEHGATCVDICKTDTGVLVADNGVGLEQSAPEKVFVPFYTTKRDSGGTGLGLNIVQNLTESVGLEVRMWRKKGGCVVELSATPECVA